MDCSVYLFAAALGSMGWRLEKIISTVLSAREGCHLESKKLATLISLIEKEERETSPPIRLSAVQMQFDFGDI